MLHSKNSIMRYGFAMGSGLLVSLAMFSCKVASGPGAGTGSTSLSDTAPTASGGGTVTSGGGTTATTGTTTTTPPVIPTVAQVGIGTVSPQTMNLGVSISIPVALMSQNSFAGRVALSVNTALLSAQDPNKTFTVSVLPASVRLTAGGAATATVSIVSTSASPDLTSAVTLVATPSGRTAITAQIPITVNAIYDVNIMSSGTVSTTGIEDWSLPALSKTMFATHTNGITIRFNNLDTVENSAFYRVHSSGTAFLHQGMEGLGAPGSTTPNVIDGAANSTLPATTVGPVYTVDVKSQVAQLSDLFYDHNNENAGAAGRTMVFNAYATPAPVTKSGNPNASFAYLQTNLFGGSQCVACHSATSAATAGGGVNLSTYAGVLTQVTAGSHLNSPLFVNIATGTANMPLNDPGSVSAGLQADVENWIDDGALNN